MTNWTELNQAQLRRNITGVADCLGGLDRIMAVVKSNGYGHGLEPVVEVALAAGLSRSRNNPPLDL